MHARVCKPYDLIFAVGVSSARGIETRLDERGKRRVRKRSGLVCGNLARYAAHTREWIGVGICDTMHVARARHVINIRYRNSRLNSLNGRVSTFVRFERSFEKSCYPFESNFYPVFTSLRIIIIVWISLVIWFNIIGIY